jgi:hypothetical protein
VGNEVGKRILGKISSQKKIGQQIASNGRFQIYYTRKLSGFVQILDFIPKILDRNGKEREPSELKMLTFTTKKARDVFLAALNSSLFYWFLTVNSDCRNLNKREILNFPLDFSRLNSKHIEKLIDLSKNLMVDIKKNSEIREMSFKNIGKLTVQCTFPKYSKHLIDEIDAVLAKHYNLHEQEEKFIINYDLVFRIGEDE